MRPTTATEHLPGSDVPARSYFFFAVLCTPACAQNERFSPTGLGPRTVIFPLTKASGRGKAPRDAGRIREIGTGNSETRKRVPIFPTKWEVVSKWVLFWTGTQTSAGELRPSYVSHILRIWKTWWTYKLSRIIHLNLRSVDSDGVCWLRWRHVLLMSSTHNWL